MGAYRTTYEYFVHPTHSQQFWEQTDYLKPDPPPHKKKKAGRPKKNKRKDANEERYGSSRRVRMRKAYGATKCSNCRQQGHNIKRYKEPIVERPKKRAQAQNNQVQQDEGAQNNQVQQYQGAQNNPNQEDQAPPNIHMQQAEISVSHLLNNLNRGTNVRAPRAAINLNAPSSSSIRPPQQRSNVRAPRAPINLNAPASSSVRPHQTNGRGKSVALNLNAHNASSFRPHVMGANMFRPPSFFAMDATMSSARPTTNAPPIARAHFQVSSSPPVGPISHDFNGGAMRFMPTPSMKPRAPQNQPPHNQ